jgi:surface carbohydrate biosynthesis protein
MRLKFLPPKQREIALFDASGLEEARCILKKNKYEIIYCRKENINIFVLIKAILKKNFFFKKIDYYNQYLKEINPKLLITFNDNNYLFHKLNKKNVHSVSVQNGSRSYHNDILEIYKKLKKKVKIDKYFVFNKTFQKELSKFVDTKFSTLGSPLNNNIKKKDYNFINTALYITPFSLSTFLKFKKDKKKFNEFYHRETEFIKKINFELNKKNIKLSILGKLRDHNKSIEKKLYKLRGIKFIENYKDRKTFDIASKFEILIGPSSSTLTYEMLAREKKMIVLNRDYNHYPFITKKFGYFNNLKDEGPFWIISGNEYKFIKLFDKIKSMSKKKWLHLLKKYKEDTCEFNYLNKKLKNHIKNITK